MLPSAVHRHIFLFGLCGLAFGMMVGTVPTSVPQFILLGNWLLEADFKRKWLQLRRNLFFWLLSSVFLVHALGLLWTQDLGAGWDDVRTKMPLMFLPLIFFTTDPLRSREFRWVLYAFLAGCVVNIGWCYVYSFVLHVNETVRNASRFMSHIRLGLYLNMAIAVCAWLIRRAESRMEIGVLSFLILLFVVSMNVLGLFTGIVNMMILLFFFSLRLIWRSAAPVKLAGLALLLALCFFCVSGLRSIYQEQTSLSTDGYNALKEKSASGRPYVHPDTLGSQLENGNMVHINIQWDELRTEWNRRVPQDTFSYHPPVNITRYEVLLRYLSSKGLPKDSSGLALLNEEDIRQVRAGIPNYRFSKWSFLRRRLYEAIVEYEEMKRGKDVNGRSVAMRPWFWRAALHVIGNNPAGVGTGDVQAEMNKAYRETSSPLSPEWFKRPHNQFLTVAVALGAPGVLVFFCWLIFPLFRVPRIVRGLYAAFFILALLSYLMEDTLESQAGLTFVAFFTSVLLVAARDAELAKMPHTPAD